MDSFYSFGSHFLMTWELASGVGHACSFIHVIRIRNCVVIRWGCCVGDVAKTIRARIAPPSRTFIGKGRVRRGMREASSIYW